jgi:hypothetical protein
MVSLSLTPKRYLLTGAVRLEEDRTVEGCRCRRREVAAGTAEVGGRRRAGAPAINGVDAAGRCR